MLDVFEGEPLGSDNPFRGLANVILTPHVAGVTVESNERVSAVVAETVLRVLSPSGDRR
jgi:(S)-sulfolactate dehydrogenase